MTNEYEPPPQLNITENASTSAIWRRWLFGLWSQVQDGIVSNYALDVSRGRHASTTWVNKFGRNTAVASGVEEEIWDGSAAYSFPDTALMTSISQTSDQTAMRGANIEIQGLNAAWELIVQTIPLDATNTTTPVVFTATTDAVLGTTGVAMLRVFRVKVLADVIGDSSIRVHNVGETVDYAVINAGNNQTEMAIFTVPAGRTAFMTNYYAHHNPTSGQQFTSNPIRLWAKDNANSYERQIKHITGLVVDRFFQHQFEPYPKFTEKTDIYLTSAPVGGAADISAGFDLYLDTN